MRSGIKSKVSARRRRLPSRLSLGLLMATSVLVIGAGCSGRAGLGTGTGSLRMQIMEQPGAGFGTAFGEPTVNSPTQTAGAIGFDLMVVPDGPAGGGVRVSLALADGSLVLQAVSNQDGKVQIGAMPAGHHLLTVQSADGALVITAPLVTDLLAAYAVRVYLYRDGFGAPSLNLQAITDSNLDGRSDEGSRLTVLSQQAAGNGRIRLHHGTSQGIPAELRNTTQFGTIGANGTYTVGDALPDPNDDITWP